MAHRMSPRLVDSKADRRGQGCEEEGKVLTSGQPGSTEERERERGRARKVKACPFVPQRLTTSTWGTCMNFQ